MSWLAFHWARWRRDEAALAQYGLAWPAVDALLRDKSVALVGNARALAQTSLGAAIDEHDLVMRLNAAPMPARASHGARCDLLATSIPVGASRVDALDPALVLWMTRKRKRLAYHLARRADFYLNPLADWQPLADKLGAPPSTGAMAIDLLSRSSARSITLCGFDFFQSRSLSGGRGAGEVPHDFVAEAKWATELLSRDARIALKPL